MSGRFAAPGGRQLLGVVAALAAGAGLVVGAAEHLGGLQPCSLCWTQRGILALLMGVALVGTLAWPRGRVGRGLLGGALALVTAGGLAAAGRHLYVMANPEVVDCGMSPEVMLQMLPWHAFLIELVTGNTDCANVASLFGIPLPVASFVGFTVLGALSALALTRHRDAA